MKSGLAQLRASLKVYWFHYTTCQVKLEMCVFAWAASQSPHQPMVAELQQCLSNYEPTQNGSSHENICSVQTVWPLWPLYGKTRLSETYSPFCKPFPFYNPYKPQGTRLKSVTLMCQLLSVASEPFGLHAIMTPLWKGETHTNEWQYGGSFVPSKIRG
jgi:hypothetical protein